MKAREILPETGSVATFDTDYQKKFWVGNNYNDIEEFLYCLSGAGFGLSHDGTGTFKNSDNIRVMKGQHSSGTETPVYILGSSSQKNEINSILNYLKKHLPIHTEE